MNPVEAQIVVLVLEWDKHWLTYWVGGTCNFGTHNFFVGYVDDDEVVELLTEGMTYRGDYYDVDEVDAPFGVRWLECALITCFSLAFPKNFCLLRLS